MNAAAQLLDHLEAAHLRHLQIQQNDIRTELGNLLECADAIIRFAGDLNARMELHLLA